MLARKFQAIKNPYNENYLKVSEIHNLYYAEYGNPEGIPVLICHGGPGGGCTPIYTSFCDPKEYRIIFLDQRGAGKSTPMGCLEENTTEHLLNDMETLRKHLAIDKWALLGGSWGTALALLYAERFPERTLGLVLRGVFLARPEDIRAYVTEGSIATTARPEEWREYKNTITQLLAEAQMQSSGDLITDNYNLLMHHDSKINEAAAIALSLWEVNCAFKVKPENTLEMATDPHGVTVGRVELSYIYKNCFMKSANEILDNINVLKEHGIPVFAVNGQHDYVCPVTQAQDLRDRLGSDLMTLYVTDAGHAGSEPENIRFMEKSTEQLLHLLALRKAKEIAKANVAGNLLSQQALHSNLLQTPIAAPVLPSIQPTASPGAP